LFRFTPRFNYETFAAEELHDVREKLLDLIGSIAGVKPGAKVSEPENAHRKLGEKLVQVLAEFGPMVTLESDPVVGPSFLRFHVMPAPGVKVNKILPLGGDLAVQLRLSKPALIRLEGGMLVIDLERPDRQPLWFREFRTQLPPLSDAGNSQMLVGVDLNRKPRFLDLGSDCPHVHGETFRPLIFFANLSSKR